MSCKGSTTSLIRHAEALHAKNWNNIIADSKKAPRSVKALIKPKYPYKLKSKRRQSLNRSLTKMITCDLFPTSIVEKKGFRGKIF